MSRVPQAVPSTKAIAAEDDTMTPEEAAALEAELSGLKSSGTKASDKIRVEETPAFVPPTVDETEAAIEDSIEENLMSFPALSREQVEKIVRTVYDDPKLTAVRRYNRIQNVCRTKQSDILDESKPAAAGAGDARSAVPTSSTPGFFGSIAPPTEADWEANFNSYLDGCALSPEEVAAVNYRGAVAQIAKELNRRGYKVPTAAVVMGYDLNGDPNLEKLSNETLLTNLRQLVSNLKATSGKAGSTASSSSAYSKVSGGADTAVPGANITIYRIEHGKFHRAPTSCPAARKGGAAVKPQEVTQEQLNKYHCKNCFAVVDGVAK